MVVLILAFVPINVQSTIISVYISHRFWSSQYTNKVSCMQTQCACNVIKLIYGMFINLRFSNIYRINLVKVCSIDRLISYARKRCSKIIELETNNGRKRRRWRLRRHQSNWRLIWYFFGQVRRNECVANDKLSVCFYCYSAHWIVSFCFI